MILTHRNCFLWVVEWFLSGFFSPNAFLSWAQSLRLHFSNQLKWKLLYCTRRRVCRDGVYTWITIEWRFRNHCGGSTAGQAFMYLFVRLVCIICRWRHFIVVKLNVGAIFRDDKESDSDVTSSTKRFSVQRAETKLSQCTATDDDDASSVFVLSLPPHEAFCYWVYLV